MTKPSRVTAAAIGVAVGLAAFGCGSSADGNRSIGTAAPVEAAKSAFCTDLGSYLQVLDDYGRVFSEDKVTVGQVNTSAGKLTAGRDQIEAASSKLADAITAANKASALSDGSTSTTITVLQSGTADEHIAAIDSAARQLEKTVRGVDESTTLRDAAVDVQAAAFGVEQAYASLFVDAGCLADDADARRAVDAYVKGLQQDLATLGYYTATVDGVYGPDTVAAIKALQASAGLPETGVVDPATEAALASQLAAKGTQQSLNIAALQGALTATGDYSGPIDGKWTPAVEQALSAFQQSQNLPANGKLDAATLAALLAFGSKTDDTTTTTGATSSSSSTSTQASTTTTKAP